MCRLIPAYAGRETRAVSRVPPQGYRLAHGSRLPRHRALRGRSRRAAARSAAPHPPPWRLGPGGRDRAGRLVDRRAGPPECARRLLDLDRAGRLGAGRVQPRARRGRRAHGVALPPGWRTLGDARGAGPARHRLRRLRRRRIDRSADRGPLRAGDWSCGGRRSRPGASHRGRWRRAPGGEDVDGRRCRRRRPRPGRRRRDHAALLMAGGVRDPGAVGRRRAAPSSGASGPRRRCGHPWIGLAWRSTRRSACSRPPSPRRSSCSC